MLLRRVDILASFVDLTAQLLPIFNRHALPRITRFLRMCWKLIAHVRRRRDRIRMWRLLRLRRRRLELLTLLPLLLLLFLPLLLLVHTHLTHRTWRSLTSTERASKSIADPGQHDERYTDDFQPRLHGKIVPVRRLRRMTQRR